jgi:4-aminobutyrate aminotransferase/(S)-3-amino-2-methylpropionate transaminase
MTLGLTGKVAPYKTGFGPFPGEVFHALFPNELHGVSVADALQSVETLLKNDIEATRVAAFILEPVQGEGGFYIAPPDFIEGLKHIADEHGILLIADEVQTGAGRTGTWFACEQWPVVPDLICTAKSLAGGFPISGVVGRAEVMDAPAPGGLGGTYAGSPVACAAALAVIHAFEDEQLLARARSMGATLVAGLQAIAARTPAIGDVRGLGAMVAIELFEDRDPSRPDAELTRRVVAEALRRGLILLSCGNYGNVIRILVPLTAPDAQVAEGLQILSDSFAAVAA